MSINLKGQHFLTLKNFTAMDIHGLLELAHDLKQKKQSGIRDERLKGKNIVLIFEKPSTRTLCAFDVAAFDEGARVTHLINSHFGKKESIEDSARVLGRFYDGIEFRGFFQETIEQLAQHAGVPVWNGLTDNYHPTQVLADFFTIQERVNKPLNQIKLAYVGDARNNVARSLMIGCAKLGMHFACLAPEALFPEKTLTDEMHLVAADTGATLEFSSDIDVINQADVIYTDVWFSMGEEKYLKERIEQLKPYQVNMAMLKKTNNDNVIFMHCLPAFHDTETEMGKKIHTQLGLTEMEVTDEVFRSKHAVVFDQAENRLHTIKAVMMATLLDL